MYEFESGFPYYLTNKNTGVFLLECLYQGFEDGVHTFYMVDTTRHGEGGDEVKVADAKIVNQMGETEVDSEHWFITRPLQFNNSNNNDNNNNANMNNAASNTSTETANWPWITTPTIGGKGRKSKSRKNKSRKSKSSRSAHRKSSRSAHGKGTRKTRRS